MRSTAHPMPSAVAHRLSERMKIPSRNPQQAQPPKPRTAYCSFPLNAGRKPALGSTHSFSKKPFANVTHLAELRTRKALVNSSNPPVSSVSFADRSPGALLRFRARNNAVGFPFFNEMYPRPLTMSARLAASKVATRGNAGGQDSPPPSERSRSAQKGSPSIQVVDFRESPPWKPRTASVRKMMRRSGWTPDRLATGAQTSIKQRGDAEGITGRSQRNEAGTTPPHLRLEARFVAVTTRADSSTRYRCNA